MTAAEAYAFVRSARAEFIHKLWIADTDLQAWTERLVIVAYLCDRPIGDVAELAMRQALSGEGA